MRKPRLLIVLEGGMIDSVTSTFDADVEIVDRRDESEYPVVNYCPDFRRVDEGGYARARQEALLPPAHPAVAQG
jgi:hypothetical protein